MNLAIRSLLTLTVLGAGASFAQVPSTFTYAGCVSDAAGNAPPDGAYTMTFNIYDAVTFGNQISTNPLTGAAAPKLSRGCFSVDLPLPPFSPATNKPLWLEITFQAESPLQRVPMTTVPFAGIAGAVEWNNVQGRPAVVNSVSSGAGVMVSGTNNVTVQADLGFVQKRLTTTCSLGQFVQSINPPDGVVSCAAAPPVTLNTSGGIVVGTGVNLDGGTTASSNVLYLGVNFPTSGGLNGTGTQSARLDHRHPITVALTPGDFIPRQGAVLDKATFDGGIDLPALRIPRGSFPEPVAAAMIRIPVTSSPTDATLSILLSCESSLPGYSVRAGLVKPLAPPIGTNPNLLTSLSAGTPICDTHAVVRQGTVSLAGASPGDWLLVEVKSTGSGSAGAVLTVLGVDLVF